jgi:hypothetical protein
MMMDAGENYVLHGEPIINHSHQASKQASSAGSTKPKRSRRINFELDLSHWALLFLWRKQQFGILNTYLDIYMYTILRPFGATNS